MKNAENQAKTQLCQGFQPHFASFVTFPENPLLEGVFTLFFEKWVRLVKSQKLGSFGKIPKWVRFVKTVTRKRLSFRAKRGILKLLAKGIPRFAWNDRLIIKENAKNKAKTHTLEGFQPEFASFVTFPENPLPESVTGTIHELPLLKLGSFVHFCKKWVRSFRK